jgi:hypothetical protein
MEDIRMENWFWSYKKEDEQEDVERNKTKRKRQRNARWMKWARRVLMVELGVILIEGMFQFGHLVRGYNSFGGESLVLLALIGAGAWQLRQIIK